MSLDAITTAIKYNENTQRVQLDMIVYSYMCVQNIKKKVRTC